MSHQHRITRSRVTNAHGIAPTGAGGVGDAQAARAPLGSLANVPELNRGLLLVSEGCGPRCLGRESEEVRRQVGVIAVEIRLR